MYLNPEDNTISPLRRFTCFSLSLSVSWNAPCELRVEEKTSFYVVGIVGKHSRRMDGRTVGETDRNSIVRYNLLYGTNHKSYIPEKKSAPKISEILLRLREMRR